ncbi:Bgt-2707, partial [Blumeria graminis f. sp. tritici]
ESISQEKKPTKAVSFGENFEDDAKDSTSVTNNEREHTEPSLSIEDPEKNAAGEDDVTNMLKGMRKKKKVKKPADEDEIAAPVEDGGLDLSVMKKKKKSKKPKDLPEDEFAAKIAALEIESKEGNVATGVTEVDGDMEQGTGVWQHHSEVKIPYDQLLSRFFILLAQKNPDHLSSGSKSYKIPPPQCLREGNKKTIFANIAEICKRMKRTDEHVTSYLFAELGTSGSVDGSRRLVIKGRFQQKQIENVLRRYIMEYVTCKTCRSPDTELNKGENRLYFITCNSCGSRRSVTAIKTGFSAQVGKRRRQQG